jgi:hypothetical protein
MKRSENKVAIDYGDGKSASVFIASDEDSAVNGIIFNHTAGMIV